MNLAKLVSRIMVVVITISGILIALGFWLTFSYARDPGWPLNPEKDHSQNQSRGTTCLMIGFAGVAGGTFGGAFGKRGIQSWAEQRDLEKLHQNGLLVPATLSTLHYTGLMINHMPQIKASLTFKTQMGRIETLHIKDTVMPGTSGQYVEGQIYPVRYSPENPGLAMIDPTVDRVQFAARYGQAYQ